MIRRDKLGTIAKQYLDHKSYLCKDGREVLYGEDWKARIEDLRLRSDGRCEYMVPDFAPEEGFGPARCFAPAQDPHHRIRRSIKRDDRLANLQALCRFHHDLLDPRKVRSDKRERREAILEGEGKR